MIQEWGLLGGVVAAALTLIIQWLLQPVARKLNLLDHPVGRKDHAHPTPITGGLAMAVGVIVAGYSTLTTIGPPMTAFIIGSTLLVSVGLLDDKYDLPWWLRIAVQVTAALSMIYIGGIRVEQIGPVFGLDEFRLGALSVPLTVFATVGLINAINMIDGADGLAGSLVLTALLMLAATSVYSGNALVGQRIVILCGAVSAFLVYNLRFPWQRKAKLFMGNAGSAFLGYVIASLSFRLTQGEIHPVSPVLALWLIPIPVMDTLVLMLRRTRQRKSPFIADHNHIHHLMQEAGFRPTQLAVALCLFSGLCGLLAGQALRIDVPEPLILLAFFLLCAGWFWLTRHRVRAVAFFRWIHGTGVFGRAIAKSAD